MLNKKTITTKNFLFGTEEENVNSNVMMSRFKIDTTIEVFNDENINDLEFNKSIDNFITNKLIINKYKNVIISMKFLNIVAENIVGFLIQKYSKNRYIKCIVTNLVTDENVTSEFEPGLRNKIIYDNITEEEE